MAGAVCDTAQTAKRRSTIVRLVIRQRGGCETEVQFRVARGAISRSPRTKETLMNRIVYIVGAVVIIIALLSFFGLR